MRNLAVQQAVILCFGFSMGFASTEWPNEPAGSVSALDCPFSGTVCGMQNVYNTLPFASPGGSPTPLSPSSALDNAMAAGSSQGNGVWVHNISTPVREIFVGTWWSTNAAFQGMGNTSNKMIFIRNANEDNSLLNWFGSQDQPKTLVWYFQSTYDNCHVSGYFGGCYNQGDGSGHLKPNINAAAATLNAGSGWHKIEMYLKSSATKTSRDGIMRMWVDGSLAHSYTNLNLTPSGFSDVQINTAWDGSAGVQARDLSRAWHHYYDHLRVSYPNCGPSGCAAPAYLVINSSLPGGRTGAPYMATLSAEGGTKPYTWFRESGSLPNGLTLNQSTGVVSGTPTCVGRSDFTIRVTDGSQPALTAKRSYTIITTGTGACTAILNSNGAGQTEEASFFAKAVRGKVTFTLPVTSSANYRLSVYDLSGKNVHESQSMGQKEISIMTGLKNGVYVAKFSQGQKASTVRFSVMN